MALVGVSDVAKFCGITTRRVQQLVKEGLPQAERGQYDMVAAVQWYISYLQSIIKNQGSGTSNKELKDQRVRNLDIRSQSAELDLQEKTGRLIDREQTQIMLNEAMVIIATQMDSMAGRFANDLAVITDPAVARTMILNENRRIRRAAADRLSCLGAIVDGCGDSKAATGPKRRPMGKRKKNPATRKRGAGTVEK